MSKKLRVLSLFSGIGAFEEALDNIGVETELINYCEFQEDIAKAYSVIHNVPIEKNLGDITKVNEKEIADFDLMTYGFPCITGDSDIFTIEGNKKIVDIKVGNMVLTHKERFRKVVNIFVQGKKQIWKVKTCLTKELRATENHKFYTMRDGKDIKPVWKELKDITDEDYLCVMMGTIYRDSSFSPINDTSQYIQCWTKAEYIIKTDEIEEVYDIEVEEDHSMIANGVVIHNCQDISALGNQKGFFNEEGKLTRSGLFFEAMRIAKEKKPKYMIAENVRALVSKPMKENFDGMLNLLDEIGYNSYWKILNSKDYGVPHSRNRIFIVSIRKDIDDNSFIFPEAIQLDIKAKDLYDKGVQADEFYLSEKQDIYYSEMRLKKKYSSLNSDVLVCMTTKQGGKSNPQNFIKDSKGVRTLTDGELMVFQGFKREYGPLLRKNGFTTTKIGYMAGNSITVNVLEEIFRVLIPEQIVLSKEKEIAS